METVLLKADFEQIKQTEQNIMTEDIKKYQIPLTLNELKLQLQAKAQFIDITEDISIDNGALFLYGIDRKFTYEVQRQTELYFVFLPYEIDNDTFKPHDPSKSKLSFQQYTVKMLNEMKCEMIKRNQIRIRSSSHWLESIQIFPEKSINHQETSVVFEQYEDTAINSWMKFLLYSDTEKINDKLTKDVSLLVERAQSQSTLPDIYFQFYHRYLKLLYLNSRKSLIQIFSCLNAFRSYQKNLNIRYLEVNHLRSTLSNEKIYKNSTQPLADQLQFFNIQDESVFLTNPAQAQYGKVSNLGEPKQTETIEQIASNSYYCEESVILNESDGVFEVIDGQGFKIMNEATFSDFFEIQSLIKHISSFILQYSVKHGFEQEFVANDVKQFLETLNRERVVQEVLNYEAMWQCGKCRIIKCMMEYLRGCSWHVCEQAIKKMVSLISLRPEFLLLPKIFACYDEQIGVLNLVAHIFEFLRILFPIASYEGDSMMKLMLKIISIGFDNDQGQRFRTNFIEKKVALINLLKYVEKFQNLDMVDQSAELGAEFEPLLVDKVLDKENNFEMVFQMLNQEDNNFNVFHMLEFDRLRRRLQNSVLKIHYIMDVFHGQVKLMGKDYHRKFIENIIINVISVVGKKSPIPQTSTPNTPNQENQNDVNITYALLEDGVRIGKEIIAFSEQWPNYAGDTIKMLDLLMPIRAINLLEQFCFNAVTMNNLLFKYIKSKVGNNIEEIGHGMTKQFINIMQYKSDISLKALHNMRKKQSFKSDQDQEPQVNQTSLNFVQQITKFSNAFQGAIRKQNIQIFLKKFQGITPNSIYEFNILMHSTCLLVSSTLIALLQRFYLEDYNSKLPFNSYLFQNSQSQNQHFEISETIPEEIATDGLLNSRGCISNPFVILRVEYFTYIMKSLFLKETTIVPSNKSDDELNYLPGGQEWAKTQKLKIEKNTSLLSPNKKLNKFRSSGNPYTKPLHYTNTLQLIVTTQTLVIQLIQLIFSLSAPICNRLDLILFNQGLLGLEDNKIDFQQNFQSSESHQVGFYKRNQLRIRRDLESFVSEIDHIKKNIQKISTNQNILDNNQAIISYMGKLSNRIYLTLQISIITSIQQFRTQHESSLKYTEGYNDLIRHLRQSLQQIQFHNLSYLEKRKGEPPQVYPTIQLKNTKSRTPIYSKTMNVLKFAFADNFIQFEIANPYNLARPIHQFKKIDQYKRFQIIPKSNRPEYNAVQYFSRVIEKLPCALYNLFILFPQSKLIFYSTIQSIIISEAERTLRDHFIFEEEDLFNYDRHYHKILKVQLRYLIFTEFYLVNKFKVLPFEPIPELQKIDPIEQQLQMIKQIKSKSPVSISQDLISRLHIENFDSQCWKLIALMNACHIIIFQEGIDYFTQMNQQVSIILTKRIEIPNKPFQVCDILQTYQSIIDRDSIAIKTLNKGDAKVISDKDFEKHLDYLNTKFLEVTDQDQRKLEELENERNELKKMHDWKCMENEMLYKKVLFYETHIEHIVESLVAQRTNDLVFENDTLRMELERTNKNIAIKIDKVSEQIRQEFLDRENNQSAQNKEIQSRFFDYKKGINMELNTFIQEYKSDGLKKIREKTVEVLKEYGGSVAGILPTSTDLTEESIKKISEEDKNIPEDVYDRFLMKNKEILKLFESLRKLRFFYLLREMSIKEKYERKIQVIRASSSSNEDLQKKIADISEKFDIIKDELIHNKRIVTVMDNQNQMLRREIQKLKIERMKIMRERGISGAANYQLKFEQQQQSFPEQQQQVQTTKNEILPNFSSRPVTAQKKSFNNANTQILEQSTKAKSEAGTQSQSMLKMHSNKTSLISMKYKVTQK